MKCGKPTMAEESASVTRGALRESRGLDEEGRPTRESSYSESSLRVENWYYDRGRHDFIYILTFIGGTLVNIKTGGYGRGYSQDSSAVQPLPQGEEASPYPTPDELPAMGSSSTNREKPWGIRTGKIDLVGTPYGARVYLDEYYAGNLPCTLTEVEAGSHNLLVSSEGYRDWKERIEVKGGVTLWLAVHLQAYEVNERDRTPASNQTTPPKRLYKWTDGEGHIHITDTPPPDTSGEGRAAGSD